MALTEAQLATAGVLLDQYAQAAADVQDRAVQAGVALWLGFEAWYDSAAVAAAAAQAARVSTTGQDIIAGSARQFVANIVALLRGGPVIVPRTTLPPIRSGAPGELVHTRPAEAFRKAYATGKSYQEAVNIALGRAESLQVGDMSLRERDAQQALMRELGVAEFRRVVRPELAKTGSCGLCIAASDRIYKVAALMPMHGNCHCKMVPILGEDDPGNSLNNLDLERLYADAGGEDGPSTNPKLLKRARYAVNEHGEYGPVLTKPGDSFRDRSKVALEDDPKRAAHMLDKALPRLAELEAAGGPDGPLQYQRDLVAKLTAITERS